MSDDQESVDTRDTRIDIASGAAPQPFGTQGHVQARARSAALVTADGATPTTQPARPPLARLYMTSDLRAATGLARTHMDFYLREGLIQPTARTESGFLLFDDTELTVLRAVISLRQEGLGIREIRARIGR